MGTAVGVAVGMAVSIAVGSTCRLGSGVEIRGQLVVRVDVGTHDGNDLLHDIVAVVAVNHVRNAL